MDTRPRGIMKKRSPHRSAHGRKDARASGPKTGEHCPATGWWAPAGNDAGAQLKVLDHAIRLYMRSR